MSKNYPLGIKLTNPEFIQPSNRIQISLDSATVCSGYGYKGIFLGGTISSDFKTLQKLPYKKIGEKDNAKLVCSYLNSDEFKMVLGKNTCGVLLSKLDECTANHHGEINHLHYELKQNMAIIDWIVKSHKFPGIESWLLTHEEYARFKVM